MKGRAITPEDIASYKVKKTHVPDEVFDAFNDAIAAAWNGKVAVVAQEDVVKSILTRVAGLERHQVFERRWLDIEGFYRSAGWSIAYDKPAYNESYPATFTFSRRMR